MGDHHEELAHPILAAADTIAAERETWTREIEAWGAFRRRMEELSRSPAGTMTPARGSGLPQAGAGTTAMGSNSDHVQRLQRQIRTAYAETVMATESAEELEDIPAEHMAAELGPDVSTAVFVSRDPPSNLFATVDEAVVATIDQRKRILEKLDDEAASIEAFREDLRAIHEELAIYESIYPAVSFEGLVVYHDRLGELRAECGRIADRRQAAIHAPFPADYTRIEWAEYLYRHCETPVPVVSAVASTIDRIDEFRDTLAKDVADAEHRREG